MTISGPRSGYTKTPGHESTKRVVENIPLKDASKKILHALIQGPYTFSTKSMDQLFNRTKNGNKEISRNVFEKIRSGSFPIDIIFDVTRQDIDVIFYDREGGHMKIESEELFKEFCLIHRIFPWIRKIYINNGSSHDLDNLPTNEHHYSITHKLLSAGENGAYISLKTYSNLYNVKIGALIDYVESIQHLREKQISIFSQKLINRNVYEMMILEVIYKYLNEYSEKGRYHIHPQLSTFIEDHEDKIDNVVEITSSDSGSMHEPYKIGIQLTAKSNFDEKFNKIVPLIKNDIIFLDLAEGFNLLRGKKPLTAFHGAVAEKYVKRFKAGPSARSTGNFPYFINELPASNIEVIKNNLYLVCDFIASKCIKKNQWFKESQHFLKNTETLNDEAKGYFIQRFSTSPQKGLYLSLDPKDISLVNRKVSGTVSNQFLIVKGTIQNYDKAIGQMAYAINLSTLKSHTYSD